MTKHLTDIELRLLSQIQGGLSVTLTPYRDIAKSIGTDVEHVISILNEWKTSGLLRRVGAVVNHFKVGLNFGAMVLWNVPSGRIEQVGSLFASFEQVSHAYQRAVSSQWPYNLYTMVHEASHQPLIDTVKQMSRQSGIEDYKMLETVSELKKVPPTYIYQSNELVEP